MKLETVAGRVCPRCAACYEYVYSNGTCHADVAAPRPETEKRLDFLAAQTGRSKAYYLREMIEQDLEELEDYYLAADVLENIRKGKERTRSFEDVERGLGLAG